MVRVKNLNGTSSARFRIRNLRAKFAACAGGQAACCQAAGCSNAAEVTAHVIVVGEEAEL